MKKLILIIALWTVTLNVQAKIDIKKKITFKSEDGLEVTANLYMAHKKKSTPFIVLFHQAGSSKDEYNKIAPKLNKLGFNCLAIDQRSGGERYGTNETAQQAIKNSKKTAYINALPDMKAAIAHARKNYVKGKLAIWGSSYSSSLVLHLAGDDKTKVDAVLSFSPGEYFRTKGRQWVTEESKKIKIPVFLTSSKQEVTRVQPIFNVIPSKNKVLFTPKGQGHHGSKALFEPGNEEYWKAVESFLKKYVKGKTKK